MLLRYLLASLHSLGYLKMWRATWSHGEMVWIISIQTFLLALMKIPKPSKSQLKNRLSSKFSTMTPHFCCQKNGVLTSGPHSPTSWHATCHAGNLVSTNSRESQVPSGKQITSMLHTLARLPQTWNLCGMFAGKGSHAKGGAIQMVPIPTLAWDYCSYGS